MTGSENRLLRLSSKFAFTLSVNLMQRSTGENVGARYRTLQSSQVLDAQLMRNASDCFTLPDTYAA